MLYVPQTELLASWVPSGVFSAFSEPCRWLSEGRRSSGGHCQPLPGETSWISRGEPDS